MKTKSQIEKEMIIQEIEDEIRRAANERGQVAENLARALVEGEITQQQYDELKRDLLGV